MTNYDEADFKHAHFAMHSVTGSVASKGRMDWKWVLPGWYDTGDVSRLSDQQMADAGWVPVPAGSYTRTDEDTPEQYREAWQAAESAVLDERAMRRTAERERDEARGALRARLGVLAEPRPLTPDAIEVALHDCMPSVALDRLSGTQVMRLAEDMHAALTAPARDPRAEEMQADLATAEEPEMDDEDRRLIADHLAAMGYRKAEA